MTTQRILLKTCKDEKVSLVEFWELWRTTNYADKSINDYMIEKHHAVAYYGQSKEDMTQQHLRTECLNLDGTQ